MNITKYAEYESKKKSYGIAYLLWILLGWLGIHRWYTDNPVIAVLWVIISYLTFTEPQFLMIYVAVSLVEWVAIGLRVKQINDDALWVLKQGEIK